MHVTHTNANGDGHSYSYCNCYSYSYTDGDGYADCAAYAHTKATSYATSSSVSGKSDWLTRRSRAKVGRLVTRNSRENLASSPAAGESHSLEDDLVSESKVDRLLRRGRRKVAEGASGPAATAALSTR